MPIVIVSGARQVGNSTLLEQVAAEDGRRVLTLDDFPVQAAARADPQALLRGAGPLAIDEVQQCPELFVALKREVDRDRTPGRFLLSGSAQLALAASAAETLAGRAMLLDLLPFTRREVAGAIDRTPLVVGALGGDAPPEGTWDPVPPEEVLRGGMPSVVLGQVADRALWFRGYEQTYLERDVRGLAQVADLAAFQQVLRLAALRSGQLLNVSDFARDARLSHATATRYLSLLEASFVAWRLPAWRSSRTSRLLKSPKLYLVDAGLCAWLAGVEELSPVRFEPMRGALVETWVAHQLRALLGAHEPRARMFHWNVQGRHEVDFVIERGRDCLAVEVKAAERFDDADLRGLRAFLAATPGCRAGWLAYSGDRAVSLAERLWAVPIAALVS